MGRAGFLLHFPHRRNTKPWLLGPVRPRTSVHLPVRRPTRPFDSERTKNGTGLEGKRVRGGKKSQKKQYLEPGEKKGRFLTAWGKGRFKNKTSGPVRNRPGWELKRGRKGGWRIHYKNVTSDLALRTSKKLAHPKMRSQSAQSRRGGGGKKKKERGLRRVNLPRPGRRSKKKGT